MSPAIERLESYLRAGVMNKRREEEKEKYDYKEEEEEVEVVVVEEGRGKKRNCIHSWFYKWRKLREVIKGSAITSVVVAITAVTRGPHSSTCRCYYRCCFPPKPLLPCLQRRRQLTASRGNAPDGEPRTHFSFY